MLLFNFSTISLLLMDTRRNTLVLFLHKKIFKIFNFTILDKPECRKCAKALQELENIDDEADQLGIGFVKIHDETLADEYNLGDLPRLVYYRHKTPIIYESLYFCQV